MENDIFVKEIGRLIFYFKKNESKVELVEVFLNSNILLEDIRAYPYEREIEEARKEAYKNFGLKYSKRKFKY